ncbi:hypothetical protein CRM22_003257 [Opisthorchis felineus]|uniref:C2 domain-containing protein n=1 Tax=Opisthorchis felineus TaxID=147828 RepID=A0A4V3SFZ3_OPIFE|nr:hypothetical protein CRM22_003257 [Opisthorchis felineus]TGZ70324.1 hypothetical protein CRM22_003257 [Opisthorchis felineus]
MSLTVRVKYIDGLVGKGERVVKGNFRGSVQKTKRVLGRDSVYFDYQLTWPVSRPLDDRDKLVLSVYTVRKVPPWSLLGTVTVNLYSLNREPRLQLRENLVDENNRATSMIVAFEIAHQSPDGRVSGIDQQELSFPVTPLDYGLQAYPGDERSDPQIEAGESALDFEDEYTVLERMQGDGDVENLSDAFSGPEPRDPRITDRIGETIFKAQPYQLVVNVIEARRLFGTNINPVVTVTVGKEVQKTPAKFATNHPFYDSYFSFDLQRARQQLLTETIKIQVFNIRQHPMLRLLPGKVIGEFVTDVRTVYDYKQHTIFNKWAVIVDPKDPWAGPKGYVKVDMSVVEQGQQMVRNKREIDQDENIEANLILPRYLRGQKQDTMVSLAIQVYQAEDLPPMHTDISNKMRQAFVGEGAANVDPLVEVCYAGFKCQTKTKRYDASPIWNQELIFNNYFPPLTHAIRVNVKNAGIKNEIIATHLIDLTTIMDLRTGGYLPSFGPAWINLYGTPRIYTYAQMLRPEDELNLGLGEGVAYRGRLLMAITAKKDDTIERVGTAIEVATPVSETVAGKKNVYFLFASIFDATVIDQNLGSKNKPISFEISMGLFGNQLDGKRGGVDEIPIEFAKSAEGRERVDWRKSTTEPMLPRTDDKEYYFLDFGPRKPCIYMISYFEDHRCRMCIPNILERLYEYLNYGLERFRFFTLRRQPHKARQWFRTLMRRLSKRITSVIQDVEGCRGTAMRTKLDIYHARRIRRDLKRIAVQAWKLSSVQKHEIGEKVREVNAMLKRIVKLMQHPLDALPDIFISMIQDGRRVGFARVPARDIYYSVVESEKGKWNGQLATIFIRKQGREGVGEKGWKIQCQLSVYLWLGLLKDFTAYKLGIPGGVDPMCFSRTKPPDELVYLQRSRFELRCYIFIARNLIASDESGLSDPLARVLIKEYVLQTQPLYQTMSPMWDVLLHKQLLFYHDPKSMKENLQQLVVEVFDVDPGNELEFLGRCFCGINVWIEGDKYKPPGLQWWPLYRGQTDAGELLAAFDLIQLDTRVPFEGIPTFAEIAAYTKDFDQRVILKSIPGMVLDDEDDLNRESTDEDYESDVDEEDELLDADSIIVAQHKPPRQKDRRRTVKLGLAPPQLAVRRREEDYRIPDSIRPPLQRFRFEVLFWSMFGMVRQQLLPVRRPKVTIEIGGTKIESEIMHDLRKRRLFENHFKVADVYLPVDERYWPPVVMNCHDNRTFGTKVIVGTYTFSNVRDYLDVSSLGLPEDDEDSMYDEGPNLAPRLNIRLDSLFDKEDAMSGRDQSKKRSDASASRRSEVTIEDSEESEPTEINLDDINPNFVAPKLEGSMDKRSLSETGEQRDPPDYMDITAGGPEAVVHMGPTPEQLASADFWTRYFATINAADTYKEEEHHDELTDSDASSLSEKLDQIKVAEEPAEEVPMEILDPSATAQQKRKWWKKKKKQKRILTGREKRQLEIEKRRRKRVQKKKLRQKFAEKFTGDSKKMYYKEHYDDLILNEGTQGEDLSWVEKIMIYPTGLEEIEDFKGFVDPFRNFPLYKGKQTEDEASPESRLAGFLKGNLLIYAVNDDAEMPTQQTELKLFKTLPLKARVKLTVRVYVVRAIGLHPADRNGLADPYLILSLGKVVIDEKDDYKPKTLNPYFGKYYEFTAMLPVDSMLTIQVMDYDRVGSNDLIGETRIDIENRYHSPHRATCGLMNVYNTHGYVKWKDSLLPTEILERQCQKRGIEQPVYNLLENKVTVGGQDLHAITEITNESGGTVKSVEPLALEVLKRFSTLPSGIELVPEHVETRALVHPDRPGMSQGRLQLWVDIFDRSLGVPPPAIDISPRQPIQYELRVIIWNTADVILNDTSLFSSEMSSDIYVRGWVKGVGVDDQKTDIHYRSLSGEGNFNWRFIFPFDYIKAEDRIEFKDKGPFDVEPITIKSNCELTLQIWDADVFSSDNFLGGITMHLSAIPRCAKTPKSCGLHQLAPDCPRFSLFKNSQVRGWWPCADEVFEKLEVQGKVECEMNLLTAVDAENSPAGRAREEPNALPKPNRPDSSFQRILGPLNTLRYFCKYKLKWILIKILIIFLFLLIIALFIYTFPGAIVHKIVGA